MRLSRYPRYPEDTGSGVEWLLNRRQHPTQQATYGHPAP
jgi:hypothetical protein